MDNIKVIVTGGSGFIGTNMIELLIKMGFQIANIDIKKPRNKDQTKYWSDIDICNKEQLSKFISWYNPHYVIHLAARTDLNEPTSIENYSANIVGVENILESVKNLKNFRRIIVASSMLVCKLGYNPSSDIDYAPNSRYGESKVFTEKITRKYKIDWVIVRPTSIWGPWFGEPYKVFFSLVLSGFYININNKKASTKTYGYVKNSVYQLYSLLMAPSESVKEKIFYIGDINPINISEWADSIRKLSKKSKLIEVNVLFLKILAKIGDILSMINITFPLTGFRLKNMTTNNIINSIDKIYTVAPTPPITCLEDATLETICWIQGKNYVTED
jgi:nucleoside-diphosphate-sugar epimerase